jgi:hypothetical protein
MLLVSIKDVTEARDAARQKDDPLRDRIMSAAFKQDRISRPEKGAKK